MKINSKKPKGKKKKRWKKKKNGSRDAGVGTQLHPNFLQRKSATSDHWAMRPLRARQNYTLAPRELLFNLLFPYFIVCSRDHSSICNGRSRQLKNAYRYICLPFPCYCLTSVCISTSVWKPVTNPQLLVCRQLSPQWGRCWGSYRTWKLLTLSLFMYSR